MGAWMWWLRAAQFANGQMVEFPNGARGLVRAGAWGWEEGKGQ